MDRSALVVEDDAFTRTLIREVLEGSGFTVFEADSAASALKAVDRVDPDGLVVDVDLGLGPTGLDLIEALGERRAEFGILVLSNYPAQTARVAGLRPGVGHLLKQHISEPGALVTALDAVLGDDAGAMPLSDEGLPPELAALTRGQMEVLRLIALGLSNEAIAKERGVSLRSVESLVSRLFTSLGIASDPTVSARVAAAMLYARWVGVPRGRT
jgi:DNA-binding NarL/FixJ family response regulator